MDLKTGGVLGFSNWNLKVVLKYWETVGLIRSEEK